jgi:putative addiction module CopG family antidote
MKVDLPQDAEHRVRALVSSGNFGATDAEVVSTALALLERRYGARKAAIRQALEEGERSGIAEDYSLEGLLAQLDAEPE